MNPEFRDAKLLKQAGLFGQELVVAVASRVESEARQGAPRLMQARRDQVELRPFDLDALLSPDHPARSVWAFVQALDLKHLRAQVKSVEGSAGAPAIDPAILVALWLWATIDGVGAAREIDRLCERDNTYQWLCGGVGVNYHSLADFRTVHAQWLDEQLTRSIAALMDRQLVKLDVVAQDGLRVRASAKASSFRRKQTLLELQQQAREQVQALKAELDADAGASTRRKRAARERAAREREQRLEQALSTFDDIEQQARDKIRDKAQARSARNKSGKPREQGDKLEADKCEGDKCEGDKCEADKLKGDKHEADKLEADNSSGDENKSDAPIEGEGESVKASKLKASKVKELRVSATDPEARVMKMADGGFRPAFNVQLVVDEQTQLIAGIEVVDQGTDMGQMQPMHEQIGQRYGHRPGHWLADGGYSKYEALEALTQAGTQPVVPPSRSRDPEFNPLTPKPTDSPDLAQWRAVMASPEGKALYRNRASSIECANAQFRRRGLYSFNVRSKLKARAVVLWHALAHNLMRMRSLGMAWA